MLLGLVAVVLFVVATLPIYMAIRWLKDDTYIVEIEANRWDRTKKNIQRLEHTEMPPPYDHVNCAMCREFHQVKSLEYPDIIEIQTMDGTGAVLFKTGSPPRAIAQPETIRK
jgi:hypothetical protein